MLINKNTAMIRKENIQTAAIGNEVGMLNIETGKYFVLDEIGVAIWDLLASKITLDELVDELMKVYQVDRQVCETETLEFLENLVAQKLIVVE